MTVTHDIGKTIRVIRERRNMSLSDLSRASGVSRGYLYQLERGENSPTQEKLAAIANALHVTVSELIGELGDIDYLPTTIPDSLRKFAAEKNLPPSDIVMLSKINYRGHVPQSVVEWGILYSVIKGTLDKD